MNKNTIIITGASSGLGKEYLKQLLSRTDILEYWIIARRKEVLEEIAKEDPRIIPVPCDLCKKEDLQTLIDKLDKEKPNVKLLVNNAGLGKVGNLEDLSMDETDSMIDLNIKASTRIIQIVLPFMSKGSAILNVASIAGFQPMPGFSVYAASKAYVLSLSHALHTELKPRGISVTAVCPYWVTDTQFISVMKESGNKGYESRLGSTTSPNVVSKSLEALKKNQSVCTPDMVSSIVRVFSKLSPDQLTSNIMNLVKKL